MTGNLRLLTVALASSVLTLAFVLSCGEENKAHGSSDTGEQSETDPPVPSVLDCSQWEVAYVKLDIFDGNQEVGTLSSAFSVEPGWEPYQQDGNHLYVRHCITQ